MVLGIVVGCAACLLILIAVALLLYIRSRQRKEREMVAAKNIELTSSLPEPEEPSYGGSMATQEMKAEAPTITLSMVGKAAQKPRDDFSETVPDKCPELQEVTIGEKLSGKLERSGFLKWM